MLSLEVAAAGDLHCPITGSTVGPVCCTLQQSSKLAPCLQSKHVQQQWKPLLRWKELPTAAAAVGLIPDNQIAAVLPELRELQVPPVSWIHDMRTPPPHIILAEFHRQMGHSTRSEGESEGAATQWAGGSCLLCTRLACSIESGVVSKRQQMRARRGGECCLLRSSARHVWQVAGRGRCERVPTRWGSY